MVKGMVVGEKDNAEMGRKGGEAGCGRETSRDVEVGGGLERLRLEDLLLWVDLGF
jgi:hypothetical protein